MTLYKGESKDRYFPRWKMAFETVDEAAKASVDAFENVEAVSEFLTSANFDHQGLKLLRYFYKLKRDKES